MTHATDPFLRWQELVFSAPSGRYEAARDRAFWQRQAPLYDASQPALPCTTTWLKEETKMATSLLELGAGTGRLLLPLAEGKKKVTALDYSPDMLDLLRTKNPPPQVRLLCGTLGDLASYDSYEVSVCAWSLAYQPHLRETLTKLATHTECALYFLEDNGIGSPHVNLRRELSHHPRPRRAELLAEVLYAFGWQPHIHIITEYRELVFTSESEWYHYLRLPLRLSEALEYFAPFLHWNNGKLYYRWSFHVTALKVSL